MTLSRKILVRNLGLLVGLILLGTVAMLGMLSLWRSVHTASEEYVELRRIESIRRKVLVVEGLLRPAAIDRAAAAEQLRQAVKDLQAFESLQTETVEGPQTHEDSELQAIDESVRQLTDVLAAIESDDQQLAARDHSASLAIVKQHLSRLAGEADALVATTQHDARQFLRRGTLAIAVAFVLCTAAAIVISILQYRGIMRPLVAVRDAVRGIASGRFDQRISVKGEREFTELADDVNRMAGELDDLYRTLEEKVETKSRELVRSERLASVGFLAAGVAHEINNPLGIMSGFAELSLKRLRDRKDPTAIEDAAHTLQIIRDEAFRCREITEKLLTLARPGDGRNQLLSVAAAIDDVVRIVRAHKQCRGREITVAFEHPEWLVSRGSDVEFKQVFLNLIINALEATAPRVGQVRITGSRIEQRIQICVADNGSGMTLETRQRLFEPFFTARQGESRGVGLGLSITRAIVEGYGGTISAHSDGPGMGSTFTVELPASDPLAVPSSAAPEAAEVPA